MSLFYSQASKCSLHLSTVMAHFLEVAKSGFESKPSYLYLGFSTTPCHLLLAVSDVGLILIYLPHRWIPDGHSFGASSTWLGGLNHTAGSQPPAPPRLSPFVQCTCPVASQLTEPRKCALLGQCLYSFFNESINNKITFFIVNQAVDRKGENFSSLS